MKSSQEQAVITARIEAAQARNQSQRDIKAAFEAAFPGEIAAYAAANEKIANAEAAIERTKAKEARRGVREHNAKARQIRDEIGFKRVNIVCHAIAGYDYGVKGLSKHQLSDMAKFTGQIPADSKYKSIMWDEYWRVRDIYDNQPTRYKPYR